jgi:hypothetical protein
MLGHPPISLGVIKLVDVYPGLKGPFWTLDVDTQQQCNIVWSKHTRTFQ